MTVENVGSEKRRNCVRRQFPDTSGGPSCGGAGRRWRPLSADRAGRRDRNPTLLSECRRVRCDRMASRTEVVFIFLALPFGIAESSHRTRFVKWIVEYRNTPEQGGGV